LYLYLDCCYFRGSVPLAGNIPIESGWPPVCDTASDRVRSA